MTKSENGNKGLREAKSAKQDEFYTQLIDVEKELRHYKSHFFGKVVFCNCDDPEESNFWKYFHLNFKHLGLKKLVATHYDPKEPTYKIEYDGERTKINKLEGNGDFRSQECVELLRGSDVVVTNPPFSLFREYVAQLMEYEKKFIIIGSLNAISYKEIFPLLKENKMRLGCSIHSGDREFRVPNHYTIYSPSKRVDPEGNQYVRVVGVRWFANLDYEERYEDILLYKKYNSVDYPKYDNYDAINVDKTKDIPCDYYGAMGVPITFMDKFNPEQFEIVDGIGRYSMLTGPTDKTKGTHLTKIGGKLKYARIIIKRRVN